MITFEHKTIGEIKIKNAVNTTIAILRLEFGNGYVLQYLKNGYFLDSDTMIKIAIYAKNQECSLTTPPLKNSS